MKNQTYIRCPRCELNYILKKDKLCNVCKMEMKALGTLGAEENQDLEICPICKTNYITSDEEMCASCQREREYEENEEEKTDDSIWGSYTTLSDDDSTYDDKGDDDMNDLSALDDTGIATEDDLNLLGDDEDDLDEESDEDDNIDSDEYDDDFDDKDDDFDDSDLD